MLRRIGVGNGSVVTITEATLSDVPDANAQKHVALKIGVRPRPGTQNGHNVKIKVDFYDLTNDNKMRPTDARVSYNWLTSATDWSDGTTKYLVANYIRPKNQTSLVDGRRYGGFIVRVYFDGQLQDSRGTPSDLLALFASDELPAVSPNAPSTQRP